MDTQGQWYLCLTLFPTCRLIDRKSRDFPPVFEASVQDESVGVS